MKLKKILKILIGIFLFSSIICMHSVVAQNYVSTSQINAANGVAGLNANKQVLANVKNSVVFTKTTEIFAPTASEPIHPVRFLTGRDDNPDIATLDIFYNSRAGKDPWNNNLDGDTLYFSNHHGGNNYKFVGNVAVTGGLSANGHNIMDPIPGAYEVISPYNDNPNKSLIYMNKGLVENGNRKNTLMIGGNTRNAYAGIKANCQTTSGGDEGGACFQFINMSAPEGGNRSGTGVTDSTNVEMRTRDNSPLDVIGGNHLTEDNQVVGNDYPLVQTAQAGANTFVVKGTFGCGIQDGQITNKNNTNNALLANPLSYQKYGCVMTGVDVIDAKGKTVNTINVTPGSYDPQNDTTVVQLPFAYTLAKTLDVNSTISVQDNPHVNIKYYSADGIAYGVRFDQHNVEIYPTLSVKEKNLFHSRISLWTNYANGMWANENPNSYSANAVDIPNYYYGYYSGGQTSKDLKGEPYSLLNIETYYYPGGNSKPKWNTLRSSLGGGAKFYNGVDGIPGQNVADKFDYQLTYTDPVKKGDNDKTIQKHNSNYHRYSEPTLFLGLAEKNFNTYTLQARLKVPDSFTREFDSEWDYWIKSDHDYEISSKGLTMSWAAMGDQNNKKKLSAGSYMLLLSGIEIMPTGLRVQSVWKDGGRLFDTDGGFSVFNWLGDKSREVLIKPNSEQVINALGQAETNKGAYQLFSYMSNDDVNSGKDGAINNSLHFGITRYFDPRGVNESIKQYDTRGHSLRNNYSPTCKNVPNYYRTSGFDSSKCFVLGQVIFDPAGYQGGVALGSGQGQNTKLGLVVDNIGNSIVKNTLSMDTGKILSFKNSNNPYAVYLVLDKGTYTNADKKVGKKDTRGDLYIGTGVAGGGNIRGVNGYYGQSLTITRQVSAAKFHAHLSTPSSSSEPCAAGDFKDDVNYHYVCVSKNKWKRVALSNF